MLIYANTLGTCKLRLPLRGKSGELQCLWDVNSSRHTSAPEISAELPEWKVHLLPFASLASWSRWVKLWLQVSGQPMKKQFSPGQFWQNNLTFKKPRLRMALYFLVAHYSTQSVTKSYNGVIKRSPEIHFWKLLSSNNNTQHLWNLQVSLLKAGVRVSRNVESFKSWFYGKSMSRAETMFEHSWRNWQKSRVKKWKSLFPPCQEFMENCRQWKQGAKDVMIFAVRLVKTK